MWVRDIALQYNQHDDSTTAQMANSTEWLQLAKPVHLVFSLRHSALKDDSLITTTLNDL